LEAKNLGKVSFLCTVIYMAIARKTTEKLAGLVKNIYSITVLGEQGLGSHQPPILA
jgi:hypothetical protein